MKTDTLVFTPIDNVRLLNLCGVLDENLKQIETALEVQLAHRQAHFRIKGSSPTQVTLAKLALEGFYKESDQALSIEHIQLGLIELTRKTKITSLEDPPLLRTRRVNLRGRTEGQNAYIKAIQDFDITFGIGPAGTGKTYLAVANAVDALERDLVKRIILVRPLVEAGERLGFLPGDLTQKVDPYLRPLYDALYDLMGYETVVKLFERNAIEIAPLAYMRGRTLNHAFVILDEAQNTTPEQMKMFLTRIGFGSKAVITGDVTQIDLAKHQKSGLIEVEAILKKVRGICFHHFQNADIVRHPLVQKIVDAYERYDVGRKEKEL